jgi:hypothetical protein
MAIKSKLQTMTEITFSGQFFTMVLKRAHFDEHTTHKKISFLLPLCFFIFFGRKAEQSCDAKYLLKKIQPIKNVKKIYLK